MSGPQDQGKRGLLEPTRVAYTTTYLAKHGWKVEAGPTIGMSFKVTSPNGWTFIFWPYSGWFNAVGVKATNGRGFREMLKCESMLDATGGSAPGGERRKEVSDGTR